MYKIETTWGGFCRGIGRTETLHNLMVFVTASNEVEASRKMKIPPGALDDDHELVVRKFTASEWAEFEADGGTTIEEKEVAI